MANYRLQSELRGKFKGIRDGLSFLDIQVGWLGQNATAAPTSGADTGRIWVRLGNENAVPIQAMNINTRTDIPNLKVRVGKVPGANEYAVIDVHPDILNTQAAYAATLNQPLRQPELLYGERVFMERLTNLRLYPGEGLTLNVEPGYYRQPDGTWVWFAGGSLDLTSHVPGTINEKRLVLISIVFSTGALAANAQTPVSQYTDPRDGKLFLGSAVATAVNATETASPNVNKWLGAIPLIYGQTHLDWLFQYTALGHVAESLAGQYVSISGDTMTGALFIDGSADEVQLKIQGHSTQTSRLLEIENSAGADILTIGTAEPNFYMTALADQTLMRLQAFPAQTTNLFELRDSSGFTTVGLSPLGGAVFNELGNDADFRVESDNASDAIFLDASADTLGIFATPTANVRHLSVGGTRVYNGAGARGIVFAPDLESNNTGLATIGYTPYLRPGVNMAGAYGVISNLRVDQTAAASSFNITTLYNSYYQLTLQGTYSGTIANAIMFAIAAPTVSGGTIQNYYGVDVLNTSTPTGTIAAFRSQINGVGAFGFYASGSAVNRFDGMMLAPNLTTTARNAYTASAGMFCYNTSLGQMEYYNGSIWVAW